MEPREYQKSIVETCKNKNCLVIIPTGLGKTLIALLLAKERLHLYPGSKILFLAPTRPLVEQHYDYFKKYFPVKEMHIFTGKINPSKRAEIWEKAIIIFSTPQCIHNDLKNELIDLKDVSLLIEDEAHRCLKNYSYTFVVKAFKEQSQHARILGLTASPGSDKEKVKEICDNLGIEEVEVRTRESEDVIPYLQKLTYDLIKIDFPQELQDIRSLLKALYDKKVEELRNRKLIFKQVTKVTLLELQIKLRGMVIAGNKNFNILRGISVCAQVIKIGHAIELVETQTLETLVSYLDDMYAQAKEKKSKAVVQIVASHEFQDAYILATNLSKQGFEHPKLAKLLEIVQETLKENQNAKILVFAQYRDTGATINEKFKKIGIKSAVFIGQAKKKLVNGLSQKEQHAILHKFKQSEINCLVSTSIGEEGLDIPEVNLVIFYEPVPSAIRKIQRAGRTARLAPGRLVILMTKGTRDETSHWAAHHKEKKMYSILDEVKSDLKKQGEKNKQKTLF
ncbi:MAG: DEAD/DEAH box helicase family protein [Candidatus Pacearchaeota archaeon]|nr:DEAD/DEAH box helicase family protein [Candidatus Pacearchaeota archaeon]